MSLFKKLNSINVSNHIEKKGQLNYLSWAWAWTTINENAKTVKQNIYKNEGGLNYHHDGKTAWVEVGIEADGLEHIEMLPRMDFKNKSIPLSNITSMDVNKAIQRAGTKAIARHGLGMYIYAGEDLPQTEYKTASKQTEDDTAQYKVIVAEACKEKGADVKEFLGWYGLDLNNQDSNFKNAINKFANDTDMLNDQIINFLDYKENQDDR